MTPRSSPRARAREIYRKMVAARAGHPAPPHTPRPAVEGGSWEGENSGLSAQNLTEKVRALYEHSAVPVAEIAKLAGVTERTIYKYARKHDWTPRYRRRAPAARRRCARGPGLAAAASVRAGWRRRRRALHPPRR